MSGKFNSKKEEKKKKRMSGNLASFSRDYYNFWRNPQNSDAFSSKLDWKKESFCEKDNVTFDKKSQKQNQKNREIY